MIRKQVSLLVIAPESRIHCYPLLSICISLKTKSVTQMGLLLTDDTLLFFKQLVDIYNGNPFAFLGGTLSRSRGIQIWEKPSRGVNRKTQADIAFRCIRNKQTFIDQLSQEASSCPFLQT